jgi:hypothetical protein
MGDAEKAESVTHYPLLITHHPKENPAQRPGLEFSRGAQRSLF